MKITGVIVEKSIVVSCQLLILVFLQLSHGEFPPFCEGWIKLPKWVKHLFLSEYVPWGQVARLKRSTLFDQIWVTVWMIIRWSPYQICFVEIFYIAETESNLWQLNLENLFLYMLLYIQSVDGIFSADMLLRLAMDWNFEVNWICDYGEIRQTIWWLCLLVQP